MRELCELGATSIARLIRERQVSSREVIQAHLDRIDEANSAVNAVTVVHREGALAAASAADRAVAEGHSGPLCGVPFTLKENYDLAGSATTHGVPALASAIAPVDSPHVARLRAAGAIPIGRTNMPDFAFRWHTDSSLRGPTRNPWSSVHTPGGSSGGDAAAVAIGVTPLGIGGDYGGSLRVPAQACGVAALRPGLGRVPVAASTAAGERSITLQLFATSGPIARHVSDLRAAFEVMSGPHPRDPWSVPAPLAGPPAPRRVALVMDPAKGGVHTDVAGGIVRAATALAEAGYAIEDVEPPGVLAAAELWGALVTTDVRMDLPAWKNLISRDALYYIEAVLAVNRELDREGYARALAERLRIAREWAIFFETYSIVLGPIFTQPPFLVGDDLQGPERAAELQHAARLVIAVNLLGLPAVAVPAGLANGLPQAVQLIAGLYREDLCLEAAQVIEDRLGVLTPLDASNAGRRPSAGK